MSRSPVGDPVTLLRIEFPGRRPRAPAGVVGVGEGRSAGALAERHSIRELQGGAPILAAGQLSERWAITDGRSGKRSAGIAVWVPVPEETHVVQSLLGRGWAVSPGAPYRLQSERAIRVTTSTLLPRESDGLADAIEGALRPVSGTRTA